MKKICFFALKTTIGCLVALTPLTALVACNQSKPTPEPQPVPASKIFKVNAGVLSGFGDDVKQEDVNQYVQQHQGKLSIPNELQVQVIAPNAFDYRKGGIHIPNETKIIELPARTFRIEKEAFYGCTQFEEITYVGGAEGSQLQYIGDSAFEGCTSLKAFIFPYPILYPGLGACGICDRAFYGCSSLEKLDFSYINQFSEEEPERESFFDFDALKMGEEVFTGVKSSGKILLPWKNEYKLVLPASDKANMSAGLFRSDLIAAGLPARQLINDIWTTTWTFGNYDPTGYTDYVPVPTQWFEVSSVVNDDWDIVSIDKINSKYFDKLDQFDTIHIPREIFDHKPGIMSDFPAFLTTSISSTFNYLNETSALKSHTNFKHLWIFNFQERTHSGVEIIPDRFCFNNNTTTGGFKTALETVRFPETDCGDDDQLKIGAHAFDSCYRLKKVNLNDVRGLTEIGESAFAHDPELTDFSFSEQQKPHTLELFKTVYVVGKNAFKDCKGIEGLTLHESNWNSFTANESAFADLINLKTIDCSQLQCTWNANEGTEGGEAHGSFIDQWAKNPEDHIFDNLPTSGNGVTRKLILPLHGTARNFIGLAEGETKEADWTKHPHSGFHRFVEASGSNKGLFNWELEENYVISGGVEDITLEFENTIPAPQPTDGTYKYKDGAAETPFTLSKDGKPLDAEWSINQSGDGFSITEDGKLSWKSPTYTYIPGPLLTKLYVTATIQPYKEITKVISITCKDLSTEIKGGTSNIEVSYSGKKLNGYEDESACSMAVEGKTQTDEISWSIEEKTGYAAALKEGRLSLNIDDNEATIEIDGTEELTDQEIASIKSHSNGSFIVKATHNNVVVTKKFNLNISPAEVKLIAAKKSVTKI